MKNKKVIFFITLLIFLIVGLYVFLKNYESYGFSVDNTIDMSLNNIDPNKEVNWNDYEIIDVKLNKSLTISKGGIYHLTGSIKNGYIKINTNDHVKLILDNVNIKNLKGPALYVERAISVLISLNPLYLLLGQLRFFH